MKFCPTCNNLMVINTLTGNLTYNCVVCGTNINSVPSDTLLYSYEYKNQHSNAKFKEFLNNAANDPTVPRVKKDCEKCGNSYMKYVRLGTDSSLFYVCTCGYIHST